MSIRRLSFFLLVAVSFLIATGMPTASSDSIIVGRNVNMVSGTDFIGGDPYLQRQNEPSIAVSTRNPLHLLAGANDYRTIDVPYQDELPGIPEGTAARDAWLGVFKSIDGGQSWISTLLPGYPQDNSIEGTSSPISGYDAACDPVVRAGTNGLFYYSGIAFNRAERGAGVVFVARFIDNNNIEGSDAIEYVDTYIVDQGNAGQFLDMPSIAVDIPRSMTNTAMIRTAGDLPQNIPCGNVYITYTVFLGNTIENVRSKLLFSMSTDCGVTWSKPIKVSESQHILQRPTIVIDPSDPTGGTIYLAFRRFAHGKNLNAIVIVKSVDGGQTFTKPIEVAIFDPFDQGTSTFSFRSNSYPTLAVDGGGIVHLAWAQRMGGPDGFARIVIKASPDGIDWSSPEILVDDSADARGHQFMPSLTYAGSNLMMAWYDQRDDLACLADLNDPNKYFTKYIEDSEVRHTIDVRAALIKPNLIPLIYPSDRVSRYLHILVPNENDGWIAQQAEFNPPNYTLFQLGTVPFYGDWLEIVPSTPLLAPANSTSEISQTPSFHVVWTDNRDVRPPGGDWWVFPWPTSVYNAPESGTNRFPCGDGDLTGVRNQNIYTASITSGIIAGSSGNTKPTDDDVQHTFIIFVKNTTPEIRSFRLAIDVSNASFRQDLANRLPTLDVEIPPYSTVTRTVFVDPPHTNAPVRIDVVEIDTPGGNEISGGLTDSILLNPDHTNPPVYDPYNPEQFLYWEYHNPRVENPRVENYNFEAEGEMNPRVLNPRVENPRVLNPRVLNPRVENLGLLNPRVENISFLNPEMENPRVENPRVENTAMADVVWEVGNDGNTTSAYTLTMLSNAAEYDDDGNGYIPDEDIITQILVYKIHTTPVGLECDLREEHSDELILNITNPRVENPRVWNPRVENPRVENPRVENPRVENATFSLAPGEEAYVIWRIWDDNVSGNTTGALSTTTNASGGLSIEDVIGASQKPTAGAALSGHAANTEDVLQDVYDPPVSMSANVAPEIGHSPSSLDFTALVGGSEDSKDLDIENTGEGILDYTLSIEYDSGAGWLSLDSYEGQHTAGAPYPNTHEVTIHPSGLLEGTYEADIVIEAAGALNSPQRVQVTLTIAPAVTISGQVTEGGSGLEGVTMSGLPGTPTPTTDSFGNYSGTVNSGWSGTVTPTLAGHDFTPSSQPYTDVTSNQVTNYTVTLKTYTLTYTAGTGGSITGATSQTVNHGDDGNTVTAVPAGGYDFVDWSDGVSTAARTDLNVTANISVTANFTIIQYTLTTQVSPSGGGSVTKSPDKALYNHGDTVLLTATANTGYTFTGWSGDLTGTTNPDTITMDGNKNVTANFVLIPMYSLTTGADPTEGGTIIRTPDMPSYSEGSIVQLKANANTGYTFYEWTGDVPSGHEYDNPITIQMDSNKNITARFTADMVGQVFDPSDDATESASVEPEPDFVSATCRVQGRNLKLSVRFKPGTFVSTTSRATWVLDTDQNINTGFSGIDAANNDSDKMGVDFQVQMGSNYIGPTVKIGQWDTSGTSYTTVYTSVPITFLANGMDATIPLSLLGDDDGLMNFKVLVQHQVSASGFTGILDYMPDVGKAPGTINFGQVTDPSDDTLEDARVEPEPDFVSATCTMQGRNLKLSVRFKPGTFDSTTSMATWALDTDQNINTGVSGIDGAHNDSDKIGLDFYVQMGSNYIGPRVKITQWDTSGTSYTTVYTSVPITFLANGMDATIPLSLLGDDDGLMNFKVLVQHQVSASGFTGILDYMTDVGKAPGTIGTID